MLTPEQLASRKIGGSDVATILGLNPYKTALELWAEKTGRIEPQDLSENLAVEAGNVMEPAIADLTALHLARKFGREFTLIKVEDALVNPRYPWITAHIDRAILNDERGLEIKNVGWRQAHLWGPQDTDEIPKYYLPQPHTYMIAAGAPAWLVSAYFGGADLRLYQVEHNAGFAQMIIDATHDFWFENVIGDVEPDFDVGHANAKKALARVYPGTDGRVIEATAQDTYFMEVIKTSGELASEYEKGAEIAKNHLLRRMENAAILKFPDGSTLERKKIERAGYTVEPTSYIDARLKKPAKEKK